MRAEKRLMIFSADTEPLRMQERFAKAYAAVSAERREKTDRLRFDKDKRLSLGAELLLRYACRASGICFERERIVTGEWEKPRFESGCAEFNLSHSEEKVLCVLSDLPVGCDVQKKEPVSMDIARRFFHTKEYEALRTCRTEGEQTELFYRFWTLKESFIKCTGRGLSIPLDAFCIGVGEEEARIEQSFDSACYRFFENDPGDGYRYACCVRLPEREALGELVPVWKNIDLCFAGLD